MPTNDELKKIRSKMDSKMDTKKCHSVKAYYSISVKHFWELILNMHITFSLQWTAMNGQHYTAGDRRPKPGLIEPGLRSAPPPPGGPALGNPCGHYHVI